MLLLGPIARVGICHHILQTQVLNPGIRSFCAHSNTGENGKGAPNGTSDSTSAIRMPQKSRISLKSKGLSGGMKFAPIPKQNLNWSSDSLLEFITEHPSLRKFLKKDCTIPQELALNRGDFRRTDRDDALAHAYDSMWERHDNRQQEVKKKESNPNYTPKPHDRLLNPLIATQATTGGGKSRFLDEIAKLLPDDLDKLCKNEEMRRILQHSVAVTITYQTVSLYDHRIDEYPDIGLALRVLHSYFFGPNLSFVDFLVKTERLHSKLLLVDAVACVMKHSKKGVLLLVDELTKSGGGKHLLTTSVVSIIGGCLDRLPTSFNVVVTTLDSASVIQAGIHAGRIIRWVELKPATLESAKSLFGSNLPDTLQLAISDCDGHFRSLETLHMLWQEVKNQHLDYSQLIQRLLQKMEPKYRFLTLQLIKSALKGVEVGLEDTPDGLHTHRKYLAEGLYLNSIGGSNRFVPRLSPLLLRMFAEHHIGPGADETAPAYKCAKILLSAFNTEPSHQQKFHGNWELLRRILFDGEMRTLSTLYGGGCKNLHVDPQITLSPKGIALETKPHFPKKNSRVKELEDKIVEPGDNPGFDLIYSEKKGKTKKRIIVGVECRNTESTESAVKEKYKRFEKQLAPLGREVSKNDRYLVVCTYPNSDKSTEEDLPPNTIVLGKQSLTRLYSPSLSSRLQYISSKNSDNGP